MNDENGSYHGVVAGDGSEVKLAMESLWLTGRVLPVGARLIAVHCFRSAEERPVEVVYAFGLPRDAVLRQFRIEGEGFRVRSELRAMEEARKVYEEGIQGGHLASLARAYRDGRVNLSVGNIRPGELVKVFLEIVAGVDLRDDGYRFRFPFTLVPTYHREARIAAVSGGMEMELPSAGFADVILPPWMDDSEQLHRVGFDLALSWPGAVRATASPSHRVRVTAETAGEWRVAAAEGGDLPNRDLVLDVEGEVAGSACYGGAIEGQSSVFSVVVPSTRFGAGGDQPRNVVFLLDRSGSMGGVPLEQAKQSLMACWGALEAQDRFNLVVFDHSTNCFEPKLVAATLENRDRAGAFLKGVAARGGTELDPALREALRLVANEVADIFVLTDGQVSATEEVLDAVRSQGVRVHCLGIGSASQDRFLALLAETSGGLSHMVGPRERVDLKALELFASAGSCVAQEVVAASEQMPGTRWVVAPRRQVFAGYPLVLMGEARKMVEGKVRVGWESREGAGAMVIELDPRGEATLVRLLQGARLNTMIEAQHGPELDHASPRDRAAQRWRRKLEDIGLGYGLANRAISLVAVVEREGDDATQLPTTRVVPVGLPEDLDRRAYLSSATSAMPLVGRIQIVGSVGRGYCGGQPSGIKASGDRAVLSVGQTLSESHEPRQRFRELSAEEGLMEIVSKLETDGGLAGVDWESRLLRTAGLVVLLISAMRALGTRAFRRHVRRTVRFLQANLERVREVDKRQIVLRLLAAVDEGKGFGSAAEDVARATVERVAPVTGADWQGLESGVLGAVRSDA